MQIRALRRVLAALSSGAVLAACGSALTACGAGAPTAVSQWREPGTPAMPVAPSLTPTVAAPPEITLAFAGDVHFAERTLDLLDDPGTAFGPVAEILQSADLAMVNLETAVTTRGTPEPKRFHFRAPPTAYEAVKAAGIDIVSLANNHALDYGRVGLEDTISYAEKARMPFVGVGRDSERAYRPWYFDVKGLKIAIVAFSQVDELWGRWAAKPDRSGEAYAMELDRATAAVKDAATYADVVVVYMHWGLEYNECPTGAMKTFAKKMSQAGADIIVGPHAHNLLGDGWLAQTYVHYGLSNFLWWYNDAGSNDTGVALVHLTGAKITKVEFVPAYIDRKTGQPIPSTGDEADRISTKFAGLRGCTGLADEPS